MTTQITMGPDGVPAVTLTDAPFEMTIDSLKDAAKPQPEPAKPKPGDADYDWSVDYGADAELYRHTFPDGTTVALKTFAQIYTKTWLYKIQSYQTDVEVEFAAIERATCAAARRILHDLDDSDGDPLDDLFKAWMKAGTSHGVGDGLTLGN